MPSKPKRICQRCKRPITSARCDCHRQTDERPSAARRGYGWWWRNQNKTGMADRFIAENPLCAKCADEGRVVAGFAVDHIIPHRGNEALLRDWGNLQTLCQTCHAVKTARGE